MLENRDNKFYLVRAKACRRCGGDLSLERDNYGAYAGCIQCGAVWNADEMTVATKPEPVTAQQKLAAVK